MKKRANERFKGFGTVVLGLHERDDVLGVLEQSKIAGLLTFIRAPPMGG